MFAFCRADNDDDADDDYDGVVQGGGRISVTTQHPASSDVRRQ